MKEERYKHRHLESYLPSSDKKKLVLITGARQTGKTTLSRQQYPNLTYLNLDAPETRSALASMSTYSWPRDVGVAILDEIQKEPIALEKIKYCFDEKTLPFSVLLGSSQLFLLKKVRESLAGRVALFQLFPFMISEILGQKKMPGPPLLDQLLRSEHIGEVLSGLPSIILGAQEEEQKQAHDFVYNWGGMPPLLTMDVEKERKKWLRDYEFTYLERDLVDLVRMYDLEPFRKFQSIAALRSGQLLSYSQLARDVGVSVDTARRFFEYLQLSFQCFFLQPYFENTTKSLVKTPKLYWIDVGMLRQATGSWGLDSGSRYETLIVSEIYKWVQTTQSETKLYFFRTHGGLECDLILKTPYGLIGMEIKSREQVYPKDAHSLNEIAKKYHDKWLGSLVIYQGKKIEELPQPNTWAIPSHRLLT